MNSAYLFPVGAALTWGLIYALDQKILKTVSPLTLLFIDAVVTVIVFLPIFLLRKNAFQEVTRLGRTDVALILITVLLTILADVLILQGVKHLSASTASMIEISYPIFVVLFSFLLFRTTVSIPVLFGGLLIFAGSFVIIRHGS